MRKTSLTRSLTVSAAVALTLAAILTTGVVFGTAPAAFALQASDQVIDPNVLAQKVDLKVTAKEGELTGHNLVAVRLAEYSYAITDSNDANGKTIKASMYRQVQITKRLSSNL